MVGSLGFESFRSPGFRRRLRSRFMPGPAPAGARPQGAFQAKDNGMDGEMNRFARRWRAAAAALTAALAAAALLAGCGRSAPDGSASGAASGEAAAVAAQNAGLASASSKRGQSASGAISKEGGAFAGAAGVSARSASSAPGEAGVLADGLADPRLAQPTPLWKVTGPQGAVTYVMGTLHVGRASSRLKPAALSALASSSKLVTEQSLDFSSMDMNQALAATMGMFNPENPRQLADDLGEDLAAQVVRRLAGSGLIAPGLAGGVAGADPAYDKMAAFLDELFYSMRGWAALMMLGYATPEGIVPDKGVDILLAQAAKEKGLALGGLESPMVGLEAFRSLPESGVRTALRYMCDHWDALTSSTAKTLEYYEANRMKDALTESMLSDKEIYVLAPEFKDFIEKTLLQKRNETWYPQIDALAASGGAFIAVGLSHLYGKNGILERLARQGCKVEPVAMG